MNQPATAPEAQTKSPSFPLSIRHGGVTVKIYRCQAATGYESFQVADYSTGQRKFTTFSDLAEAKRQAKFIAEKLATGEAVAGQLGARERASYGRAVQLLAPTGASLEVAASVYAEAVKILGSERILEAARAYAKSHPATLPVKLVSEVADELLGTKTKNGASDRYLQDLRYRLGKFAEAFQCPIAQVTTADLQTWLDNSGLASQSRVNFSRVLGLLFNFAVRRGYLAKDHDELARLEKPKAHNRERIEVFTPGELRKLLNAASPEFLPALVIGAFCGLRTSEIERLDWREVNVAEGFVEVTARNAKTASRRIVPIPQAAAAWLAPYGRKVGRIWGGGKTTICDAQGRTAKAAGIAWKQNGLRHSFISYRLAEVQSAAQVALEAGNSPQVIFQHYRELVRPTDAQAWFSALPEVAPIVSPVAQSKTV